MTPHDHPHADGDAADGDAVDGDAVDGRGLGAGPDCEAALAEVYTYLDHQLTVVEHQRVLAHLESCGSCYEAFDFEAELRMVVASKAQSDDFPEGLRVRIMRRIEEIRVRSVPIDPADRPGGSGVGDPGRAT